MHEDVLVPNAAHFIAIQSQFANLFAVLLVKKVLSEDPLDMYLKQGGGGGPNSKSPDLAKLRASAEKASQRQSAFLLPFAFGVAPLLRSLVARRIRSLPAAERFRFHYSDSPLV